MTLAVLKFIEENQTTWREKLAEKPYSITIKDDGDYTILSYSQIHSDFKEQICRECRGLIIKAVIKGFCCVRDDYQGGFPLHCHPDIKYIPVCVGFYKFGNYGQDYCPEIDWPSARVQEKLDGSLIRVWFDAGTWHISTNNVIDAGKASTHADDYTFEQLFKNALSVALYPITSLHYDLQKLINDFFDRLDKDCTYMFEVCSPFNKVVVPQHAVNLYHIGTRNNKSFEEITDVIGIGIFFRVSISMSIRAVVLRFLMITESI